MKVELIDHMGSDLRVVNAARVSFNKESKLVDSDVEDPVVSPVWYDMTGQKIYLQELSKQDEGLVKYLAKHNHFTPFTHCMITLRETVPIFVARQRFKHTIGFSYNEISRRYVDDNPEFYFPSVWRSRPDGSVKQGSGTEEIKWLDTNEHLVWDDPSSPLIQVGINECYETLIEHAEQLYRMMIENDVAPEQARMILPQSMYTSYYTTGSLYAFARAYNLRSDPHAQMEIQQLAKQWDQVIRPLFPISWRELIDV